MEVDPFHLQQVVANLVNNADHYGDPPIEVTVDVVDGVARDHRLGPGEGVPESFVPELFERFRRAGSGVAAGKDGSGFGLYISRELIEANGGTLSVRPPEAPGLAVPSSRCRSAPRTAASPADARPGGPAGRRPASHHRRRVGGKRSGGEAAGSSRCSPRQSRRCRSPARRAPRAANGARAPRGRARPAPGRPEARRAPSPRSARRPRPTTGGPPRPGPGSPRYEA